jgi:hypothetical protein
MCVGRMLVITAAVVAGRMCVRDVVEKIYHEAASRLLRVLFGFADSGQ